MVARHASPPGNRLKAKPMADGQGEAGGTKSETNIKQSMWDVGKQTISGGISNPTSHISYHQKSYFFFNHGIMARSLAPTSSMGCSFSARRRALKTGRPA
jgi:hypothetical protein